MTKYDDSQMEHLLAADLSNRSQIKHTLKADLLEGRTHRQRPTWVLGGVTFGAVVVMVIAFAFIMGGSGMIGYGAAPDATNEAGLPSLVPSMTPFAAGPISHVVQEGETLESILALYGLDLGVVPDVLEMNGLESGAVLEVGMTLLLPPYEVNAPFPPCPPDAVVEPPPNYNPGAVITTAYPTVPPCMPEATPGPVGAIIATPGTYDPAAPTVVPEGWPPLPTPTPIGWPPEPTPVTTELYRGSNLAAASDAAGFDGRRPSTMLEGFRLTEYVVIQSGNGMVLMAAYFKANTILTVQQISPASPMSDWISGLGASGNSEHFTLVDVTVGANQLPGKYAEIEAFTSTTGISNQASHALLWNDGDFTFLIHADPEVTQEELLEVAGSLE